ncbi:MAG TPA: hypothetical protein VGC01_00615 [Mucilaginibacter sp.]
MKAKEVFIPALAGTTFMTVFSHLIGDVEQENFSEPDLLSKLFNRVVKESPKELSTIVGWNAHYLVGALFALAYAGLWDKNKVKPTTKNGLLLGGVSGIAAIAVWSAIFKIHPAPPGINFKKYYTQLWFAHVVFGICSTIAYKVIKEHELKKRQDELDQKYLSIVKP